ncbi:unnamed protein product [Rotaria socialis]
MVNKFVLTSIVATIVAVVFVGIGILIGHFAITKEVTNTPWKYSYVPRQTSQQNYQTFIRSIQAENIEANLKDLTSRPHIAGLPEDLESAQVIEERWKRDGLQVTKPRYNVLLSYPDDNRPNRVILTNGDGTIIIQTEGVEKVYDPNQPKTVNPFLAYTPNGTAFSTKLFYANYGRLEDFQKLSFVVGNASLQGSIIIMRYGRLYRGNKVMHAQYFGAAGAILYNDPADYAPFGIAPDQVYDQKWYMPPSGTQRGSAFIANGDPLTPIYPSTDYMYRLEEENVKYLPRIPAQPISYSEAQMILQYLQGIEVTADWRGSLPNVTYRYGAELLSSASIEIRSYNRLARKDTYNVIGILRGEIEPDRYIVIGNHRDAWSLGSVDPTSGTAIILEITRVLSQMYQNGFRPRRSLMFCSWGAEEYGLIGSVEYVQEYAKVLGARIVSYLNIDGPIRGYYSVSAKASPLLFDIIVEASKMVPSAYDPPGQTIYDKWMKVNRNDLTNEPKIKYGLGSASDYFAFDQLVGSSNFDVSYTFNPIDHGNITGYPLYHTSYETFFMMKKFIDPDFTAHKTIGQFVGVLGLLLSETSILPFNVTRYTIVLKQAMMNIPQNNKQFPIFRNAVNDFEKAAQDFEIRCKSLNINNPYEIRAYNDQLLQLERAFLNPLGQGEDHTDLKHIIYAPAKINKYDASDFPTIGDALASGNQTEIDQAIAIAIYFIRGSVSTLKQYDKFMF